MKDCPEIQILLDDYLDGTLRGVRRNAVESHLRVCAACRERVEAEKGVIEMMRRFRELPCPERVRMNVERRVRPVKEKRGAEPWWRHAEAALFRRPLSMGLAGLAVTAVLVLVMLKPFGENEQRMVQPEMNQDEIARAKEQANWSLAYIGNFLKKTEKSIVEEVLIRELPGSMKKGLRRALPLDGGDLR